MSRFYEAVSRAEALLRQRGRLSLRGLGRELDLAPEDLDALVDELVEVHGHARREGSVLAWAGEAEAAAPASSEPPPEGPAAERRQLTVLFCDLVDSTGLAAGLDPEDWREVVRRYQSMAAGVVEQFEGHVAQLLGDGLLVYFGWPVAHEDDAERAVRAGREMLIGLGELNEALVKDLGVRLAARVGVHTGPVVVGEMRGGTRAEMLAVGETTNLAARIQAEAEPGALLISRATLALVRGIFVTEELGCRALKGVAEPLALYRVLQPAGVRSRLDVAGARLSRFVGREQELGLLIDRWEQAAEGAGQTVFLSGEAGLGKSRLALMVRERLADEPHTWLECRSTPYTAGTAFFPVVELVGQGLAFAPGDPAEVKLRKLETGITAAGLDASTTVPLIADLLGVPLSGAHASLELSPELQRERTFEALVAWTLALAEIQPMLLLVEDLHWCDPSSLELFGRLVEQLPTSRLLLVLTARPDFEMPWAHPKSWTPVALGRLRRRPARELIQALGGERLPEEAVATILERADGVPLYLEELTRAALESEAAGVPVAIPATLQDSLMARLDRLSAAKEVAQLAAVLGRELPYRLLAAVAEIEETALRQSLERLVEADLLFQRGTPPEATYTFKHALVQEAAYGSLLRRRREELHARVAQALGERFPARAAAEPEVVARHYRAAGMADQAARWFEQAGRRAVDASAHEEAVGHFREALALLGQCPEDEERAARELAIQLALGASLQPVRGYSSEEVLAAFERARTLVASVRDPDRLAETINGISAFELTRGDLRAAAASARRLSLLEGGSGANRPVGEYRMGITDYFLGYPRRSAERLERAATALDGVGAELTQRFGQDDCAVAEAFLGHALWLLGEVDRAVTAADASIAQARNGGHLPTLAYVLCWASVLHKMRRDRERTLALAEETVALSDRHGYPLPFGVARILTGWCAIGEPTALAQITEGMATAGGTGNQTGVTHILSVLAEAQHAAGQPEQALATLDGALSLSARFEAAFWDVELHRLKGELLLETEGHTPVDAENELQRALAIARSQEARSLELRAATSLARLWRDQGRGAEASVLLRPVYSGLTEGFDTRDLIEAKALLDELGT